MANQIKIDEIDAKILRTLILESRTSFTDIAKECHITVTAVRMRYKRLWREGVINGEKMLVNPHCLGYRHIVDLGIISAPEDESKVAKFLEKKPYISQVVSPRDQYCFFGKTALKDLNELHSIIEDLESNHDIKHVDALIWAEAANIEYPENLVIKPLKFEGKNNKTMNRTSGYSEQTLVKIDEIDRKIAETLADNARTPFKKIAADLGISSKTVIQRYKKLRENLLTLSTITVDLNKLGYTALANIYIKLSNRSRMLEVNNQLLQIPNMIVIIRLIGAYDVYCAVALENFNTLFETEKKIKSVSGFENRSISITPMPSAWPLHLFPSLLKGESVQPKYWPPAPEPIAKK